MKFIDAGLLLAALSTVAMPLFAQDDPFSKPESSGPADWTESPIKPEITGFVKYRGSGDIATSISVRLQTTSGAFIQETRTGKLGEFSFPRVACGDYVIALDAAGYRPVRMHVEHSFIPMEPLQVYLVRAEGEASTAGSDEGLICPPYVPAKARKEYEKGLQALTEKNEAESIAHLQKAVDIYPTFELAYMHLGWVYFRQRSFPQAREALEKAIQMNPKNAVTHAILGNVRRQENQVPEAVQELEQSLSLEEASSRTHQDLGEILLKQGKLSQAYPHIFRAHQLNPGNASIHLEYYNTLILRNEYASAAAELDEFLLLFPKHALAAKVRQQREDLRARLEQARQ